MKAMSIKYFIRMLALLLFTVAISAAVSCDNAGNSASPSGIQGVAQKGPFITGSQVFIQELDENLVPTGTAYETTTIDDQGSFNLDSQLQADLVEISITGFYYNEVLGELSAAPQTLRLLADMSQGELVNANVLTQICMARVRSLVADGTTLTEAKDQAKGEVLTLFNIDPALIEDELHQLDLSGPGVANASLLYASAVLLEGRTEAESALLLAELELDLEENGMVDDPLLIQQLDESKATVDLSAILANLSGYYSSIGAEIVPPDVEGFLTEMDQTPPEIVSFLPVDGTTIAVGTPFEITFTEPVAPSSLEGNVQLSSLAGAVTCALTTHGSNVTVTPEVALDYDTAYTLEVTTGVTDLGGNALALGGVKSFRTEIAPDTTAPVLVGTAPANGMVDVLVGSRIEMVFSEALNPASLAGAITLSDGTVELPLTMSLQGATLMLTPVDALAMNQTYWLDVTMGIQDLAGNSLDQTYQIHFTTELPVVEVPSCGLALVSVNPDEDKHNASIHRNLVLTMNMELDKSSMNENSLWLYGPDGVVHGRIQVHDEKITFKPFEDLRYDTEYELHLKDLQGKDGETLCEEVLVTFTTQDKRHHRKHNHRHHDHDDDD